MENKKYLKAKEIETEIESLRKNAEKIDQFKTLLFSDIELLDAFLPVPREVFFKEYLNNIYIRIEELKAEFKAL